MAMMVIVVMIMLMLMPAPFLMMMNRFVSVLMAVAMFMSMLVAMAILVGMSVIVVVMPSFIAFNHYVNVNVNSPNAVFLSPAKFNFKSVNIYLFNFLEKRFFINS